MRLVAIRKMTETKTTESWESDMRRGLLKLLVLSIIKEGEDTFGYAIAQSIRDKTADKLIVQDGTLYPLLRRLAEQKLVNTSWDLSSERPRKFYKLTLRGEQELKLMLEFWTDLAKSLDPFFRTIIADRIGNGKFEYEAKFCTKCGAQVYPAASFCAACGKNLMEREENERL
jgi:PadR family transcriptional regulator PadR